MAINQYLNNPVLNPLYERFRQTTTGRYLLGVFADIKRTEGLGAALSNDWHATSYRSRSRLEGAFDGPGFTAAEQRIYDRAIKIAQDRQDMMRRAADSSHELMIRVANNTRPLSGSQDTSARYIELVQAADAKYIGEISRINKITPEFTPEIARKLKAYAQRRNLRKIERLDALL